MPQKAWADGEEVLAADFNQYMQNQVVPQFSSTADRDANWPAPPNGALCVTTDNGAVWQRLVGAWFKTGGRLVNGYNDRTTDAGPTGTEAATGLSITVTVPAQRLIRVECGFRSVNSNTANLGAFIRIKEGAAVWMETQIATNATFAGNGGIFGRTWWPTAGSHTYTVTLAPAAAGTVTMQAAATYPMWIEAIDMGPA